MSLFHQTKVVVTDHAVYQFVLRFPEIAPTNEEDLKQLQTVIRREVKEAIEAHRVSSKREKAYIAGEDPTSLYAWTPGRRRVYSLRIDENPSAIVVTTVMRPEKK